MINIFRRKFECPICEYKGPFADIKPETGLRKYAKCPGCSSLERHRLQYLVFKKIFNRKELSDLNMLHFAPETFMEKIFSSQMNEYLRVDLNMKNVDCRADMRNLPFLSKSFHVVYASHVLEHIKQDLPAINEIKRVLAPGGIAILPVPVVSANTIEYSEPNRFESNHVRAPGKDYFERYKQYFSRVEAYNSSSFDEKHQLYIYEDRSKYPSVKSPDRASMEGKRHLDYVPVCYS